VITLGYCAMKWGPSHKIVRPIVFPFAAQIYSDSPHKTTNDGERPLPHSSWTAAIQSGSRDARRYQSHQRTQGHVLWQRGGRGQLQG
jgi:hypothetical protein